MNETKQFIEDAIEGGYSKHHADVNSDVPEVLFLQPEFWQAVGKTRGWEDKGSSGTRHTWNFKWLEFINNLADEDTIEEALTAIR